MSENDSYNDTGNSVDALLSELQSVPVPAELAGDVMTAVQSMPRHEGSNTWVGGTVMAKKVLIGLAAAAAIVLCVLAYTGFPPAGHGVEGTIGAATRYRAEQIKSSDVKITDAEVQDFMQSDVFHKLVSDKAARQALANPAVAAALANPASSAARDSPQVVHAL